MNIYSDLQKVASEVLTEFDQKNITLIQRTYTPADGEEYQPDEPPEPTEKKYSLRGVARGVSQFFEKNAFVADSDGTITTSVLPGITPSKDDGLELDGVVFKILQFEPVPRVGTPCVWKFIVRKGG